MEQICFLITGSLIILAALWFGTVLFRLLRAPAKVLKYWEKMDCEDIERLCRLCEDFFLDELQSELCRKELFANVPELLKIFPDGECLLKGYLLYGTPVKNRSGKIKGYKKNKFYRKGEYFHGFTSILLSCFIGESLRITCKGQWQKTHSGFELRIQSAELKKELIFSPVQKLAGLNCISTRQEKEKFEEYLLELCSHTYKLQK